MSPLFDSGDITDIYDVIYIPESLKNGTATNMAVDGSVTSQEFSWTATTYDWYLESVNFTIIKGGMKDVDRFGNRAVLTNGLLFQIKAKGTTFNIANLQSNLDLKRFFTHRNFVSTDRSKLIDEDMYSASVCFDKPIRLRSANSDFVKFTVRDDLSGLTRVFVSIEKYRVI